MRAYVSAVFGVSLGCPEWTHLICTQLYLLRLPDVDSAAFFKSWAVANTLGGQCTNICGTAGPHLAYSNLVSLCCRLSSVPSGYLRDHGLAGMVRNGDRRAHVNSENIVRFHVFLSNIVGLPVRQLNKPSLQPGVQPGASCIKSAVSLERVLPEHQRRAACQGRGESHDGEGYKSRRGRVHCQRLAKSCSITHLGFLVHLQSVSASDRLLDHRERVLPCFFPVLS